jgi:hypothetical protein
MVFMVSKIEASMKSFFSAYNAYERRVVQGELDNIPGMVTNKPVPQKPLMVRIGDLLIQIGQRLKRQYVAEEPLTWSPMTGSKP